MGRDMYTLIRDTKTHKILWASTKLCNIDYEYEYGTDGQCDNQCFCGRYDETNRIASYCSPDTGEYDFSNPQDCQNLVEELEHMQEDADTAKYNLRERIEDAHEAARHAPSVEVFYDFQDLINQEQEILRSTYWNRADDMCRLMRYTVGKARGIASASYHCDFDPRAHGLQLVWVNDE